jgi:hypothetical protein
MYSRYLLLLPAILFFSCGPETAPLGAEKMKVKNCFCSDTTKPVDELCSDVPHEVLIPFNMIGYDSRISPVKQPPFDQISWQSFVALNWPADMNGNPRSVPFGSDNTSLRVWENYALADTVFIAGDGKPLMQLALKPGDDRAKKQLYQLSKFAQDIHINGAFFEADGSTLIDKNLNYVLYEERINADEWNYINNNGLRTQTGQLNYIARDNNTKTIDLPAGFYPEGQWGNPDSGAVGAIEIKAAWRILNPAWGDDTSHYYHQQALVTIPGENTWSGNPLQFTATVGLVGLHILHNTEKFNRQIWSTFEHIDNAPDSGAAEPGKIYTFFNPSYKGAYYQKPQQVNGKVGMWNDTPPYALAYGVDSAGNPGKPIFGTQAPRYYPIYISTDSINKVWRQKLQGTIWYYYQLVGTQWFSGEELTTPNAPIYLANTTLETYIQPSASCITCHNFAVIAGTPEDSMKSLHYRSDFSFLFRHASK